MNFPREAEAVRQYIRDNVGRPKTLPKSEAGWSNPCLRWDGKCPLGLCPDAIYDYPARLKDFKRPPPFTFKQMIAFLDFWERESDPQYAVDTVWEKN